MKDINSRKRMKTRKKKGKTYYVNLKKEIL